MTVPFQFGLPQIILIIIGLLGLWLFIRAALALIRGYEIHEEKAEYIDENAKPHWRRHRRVLWKSGLGGVLLVAIAVSLLWLAFLVQTYLGLTGNIKVAQIRATKVSNIPHVMSVELVLYDQNGKATSDNTYIVQGDEWMLQGDILKFPSWMNILGFHSGFKLTRLESRYDNPQTESMAHHTVIVLNGGDDNFFTTVQQQAWTSPFVDSAYGSSAILSPDGHVYNIFVSQDALVPEPAK
ncbi:MAG: hypothetical protein NVS3B14_10950 [Ktedonobacteraceae bacterium]